MNRGDKLYRVWNGNLETATFIKEQILDGATIPTWTVRYKANERVASTSIEYWELTELVAWKKYRQELREAVPHLAQATKEAQAAYKDCIKQLHPVAVKIEQLST